MANIGPKTITRIAAGYRLDISRSAGRWEVRLYWPDPERPRAGIEIAGPNPAMLLAWVEQVIASMEVVEVA
jgi:hypothetical protein